MQLPAFYNTSKNHKQRIAALIQESAPAPSPKTRTTHQTEPSTRPIRKLLTLGESRRSKTTQKPRSRARSKAPRPKSKAPYLMTISMQRDREAEEGIVTGDRGRPWRGGYGGGGGGGEREGVKINAWWRNGVRKETDLEWGLVYVTNRDGRTGPSFEPARQEGGGIETRSGVFWVRKYGIAALTHSVSRT